MTQKHHDTCCERDGVGPSACICEEQEPRPWIMRMFAAKEITDPCRAVWQVMETHPDPPWAHFQGVRTPGFSRVTAGLSRKSPALLAGKACQIGIHHSKQAVQPDSLNREYSL